MKKTTESCLIKHNDEIREILFKRITERNMLWKEVIADAAKLGRQLHQSQLSRYFNKHDRMSIGQSDIIWLCKRYGVTVTVNVEITRYNEKDCINRIKRDYPGADTGRIKNQKGK